MKFKQASCKVAVWWNPFEKGDLPQSVPETVVPDLSQADPMFRMGYTLSIQNHWPAQFDNWDRTAQQQFQSGWNKAIRAQNLMGIPEDPSQGLGEIPLPPAQLSQPGAPPVPQKSQPTTPVSVDPRQMVEQAQQKKQRIQDYWNARQQRQQAEMTGS